MARTTPELVANVLEVEEGKDLSAQIDTANVIVTQHCTSSGYSDSLLELIERWLSAHFHAVHSPRTTLEAISGGTQEQYERFPTDLFLYGTKFGQQAMLLDYAGNLAALCNSLKVVKTSVGGTGGRSRTEWVGTELEAF